MVGLRRGTKQRTGAPPWIIGQSFIICSPTLIPQTSMVLPCRLRLSLGRLRAAFPGRAHRFPCATEVHVTARRCRSGRYRFSDVQTAKMPRLSFLSESSCRKRSGTAQIGVSVRLSGQRTSTAVPLDSMWCQWEQSSRPRRCRRNDCWYKTVRSRSHQYRLSLCHRWRAR